LQIIAGHGEWKNASFLTTIQRIDPRYFKQDDDAGSAMTQILASLPPSQKASYSRVQASVRSAFHRSVQARRRAEFHAHLRATQPGGSLMPHARLNLFLLSSELLERFERMERFTRNWCTAGMPGTKPFFEA